MLTPSGLGILGAVRFSGLSPLRLEPYGVGAGRCTMTLDIGGFLVE